MSFGLGFAFPAYPLRGGGGNNPFNQSGPTLDLTFAGVPTDLSDPNGYSLSTDFIVPQYQIAAQYSIWENDVGLVSKTFSQIITFSRASGATWFNSVGVLQGVDFSVTSNTIGTGSKSFTLDATAGVDRYWAPGDTVLISDQANSANNMVGTVTSYNASTQVLVCNITSTGGSGTITSWRIGSTMPRFDYDPATLAARGFLIEEQRQNLLTYSEDFSNADWVTTDITVTADNTAAPDGTTTADLLTEGTAGTAFITRLAAATVSAGATVTGSFFVKRSAVVQWLRVRISNTAATNGGNVWFDIQNGVLGNETNIGSGTNTVGRITPINNGWYRITATTTLAAGDTTALTFAASASADGSTTRLNNSAYWLWGAQVEAGAFPTSYIPTTTTALTRSVDVASVNTLSPWYNASEGTLFAEVAAFLPSQIGGLVALNDGTASNRIDLRLQSSTVREVVSTSGVPQSTITAGSAPVANAIFKISGAYKLDDFAASLNGAAAVVDPSGTVPTVNRLLLAAVDAGVSPLSGYLRRITYYPRRLSNAELVSITA